MCYAIYGVLGVLPFVDINRSYAEEQLRRLRAGLLPSDQWHACASTEGCAYAFSELGEKLLAMREW